MAVRGTSPAPPPWNSSLLPGTWIDTTEPSLTRPGRLGTHSHGGVARVSEIANATVSDVRLSTETVLESTGGEQPPLS